MEEGLKKLAASAAGGRLKDAGEARERLGRLRERYWRAGGAFDVTIAPLEKPEGKMRLSVTWHSRPRLCTPEGGRATAEGCYLLRTNLTETDPAVLWKRYIQLTEAEWAFRITKDELAIRPGRHGDRPTG